VKLNRVGTLGLVLLLSATGCTTSGTQADTSDIVIGADLELTGAYAPVGTTYQRALQLQIDQINAAGGVRGHHLRLDARDNHSDQTVSITNISDLSTDPGLAAIVIGACPECAIAVSTTLNNKQIPTVSLAPSTDVVTPVAEHPYLFKIGPNAADSAALLGSLLQADQLNRVALLSTDDSNGVTAMAALGQQVPKGGVVSRQQFKDTDTDLTDPVRAALTHNPDALVVSAFSTQASEVAAAARTANYHGRIFFDATAAGDLFLNGTGAAATEGAQMVGPQTLVIDDVVATSPAKTLRKQWFSDYTSKFGGFSGYSTYAADAVQLVANAIVAIGGVDHVRMRAVMETSQFEGLSGPLRFTPDNHSGLMPQALTTLVVVDGRWRLQAA
jgi:branched-chain amino acid transport system substrate-binding protein